MKQKNNTKIDILTYFNHHHKILYDLYFRPTFELFLSKNFRLITKYSEQARSEDTNDYGYQNSIWQKMIVDRFDIILNHIQSNKNNEIISIFSDVDIVFFGDFFDDLQYFIKDRSLSVVHMPEAPHAERHYINGGFFAFRHCDQAVEHFTTIKQMLLSHNGIKNDQPLIQEFIRDNNIDYADIMPYFVFNANNCDIFINERLLSGGLLKVFHATSTESVYDKILVLNRMCLPIKNQLLDIQKQVHRLGV